MEDDLVSPWELHTSEVLEMVSLLLRIHLR